MASSPINTTASRGAEAALMVAALLLATSGTVHAACKAQDKSCTGYKVNARYSVKVVGACDASANGDCEACLLYCDVTGGPQYCGANTSSTCYFISNGKYAAKKTGGNDHWLVIPTVANRGFEDWAQPSAGEAIWDAAWQFALKPPGNNPSAYSPHDVALGINSVPERDQHQMHIHVANIKDDYRQKLSKVGNTWVNIETLQKDPCSKQMANAWVDAKFVLTKGLPSSAGKGPFQEVQDYCTTKHGVASWQDCTVLVVGAGKGEPEGYYIVGAHHMCVEHFLK